MIRRLVAWAAVLGALAAAGCEAGSGANPKVQGDPPANAPKPLPLHPLSGGSPTPGQPASPTIRPAG